MKEESLKNKAYRYIKDKIVTCEYEPGDFLDEKLLIKEINASRTPIREALNKIEQEKLIQILPKKGVIVSNITLKNVVDVYQIRELIEPGAIELHNDNIDKNKLLYFKELFSNGKDRADCVYFDDDAFHGYLITCYNNDYINKLMEEIRTQSQRIRIITGRLVECLDNSIFEHLEIIDFLLKDEVEKAAKSMREHIRLSKKRTMDIMQKM